MISGDILIAFSIAAALLAMAPGPDNIFVLTQSALNGSKSGLCVVLGLCSGLLVHTAAVALGLAALIQASAVAFTVLKLGGAAYLLYLAWHAFRAKAQMETSEETRLSWFALYRRGIIMNVTNPKVAIFFLAFFPQFITPAGGNVGAQIGLLGVCFVVVTFFVFGGIALAAGWLRNLFVRSPSAQVWLNRIAGVVFVGLALKVALSER